jgi:hypothetical protein
MFAPEAYKNFPIQPSAGTAVVMLGHVAAQGLRPMSASLRLGVKRHCLAASPVYRSRDNRAHVWDQTRAV